MCCVLFAWLTAQPYFKELTSFDVRQKLYSEKMQMIEDQMPVLPMTMDELAGNPKYFRSDGVVWETVDFNID